MTGWDGMRPQTVAINTSLALVLLAAAVGAVLQVDDPSQHKPVETTAVVSEGPVTTTVSAAGNIGSPRTVGLPFAGTNPGLIKDVYVTVGQTVEPGQKLAAVDDRTARNQLAHAKANVAAAEAQILAAKEGERPAERRLDLAHIAEAIQQADNAHYAFERARKKQTDDQDIQDTLVKRAQDALTDAFHQLTDTTEKQTTGQIGDSIGELPPSPLSGTDQHQTTEQHTESDEQSSAAVSQARTALEQARAQRSAQAVEDEQAAHKAYDDAALADRGVDEARAQAAVNALPPKPDKLASAEAQLADAEATVADAQLALDNTVLTAPFRGTVLSMAGGVGETPLAAERGTSAASIVPAGPGSAENRSAATQSGFVILADMRQGYVTAEVNEADIGRVAKGQSATVTFPATGVTAQGTVEEIRQQETVINNVVEYDVAIKLDKAANVAPRPGQSASVQIITASKPNVLRVPNAAIIPVGETNQVTLRRKNHFVKVPVTIGLVGDSATEVSGNLLHPGDVVVLPESGGSDSIGGQNTVRTSGSRGLSAK